MSGEENDGGSLAPSASAKFPFFIVGVAATIGILLFIGALYSEDTKQNRRQMECVSNLMQIDGVSQAWALESKKAVTDTYSLTDTTMLQYTKGSVLPICPSGGTYTPGTNLNDVPRCNVPGHQLLYKTPMGGYPR